MRHFKYLALALVVVIISIAFQNCSNAFLNTKTVLSNDLQDNQGNQGNQGNEVIIPKTISVAGTSNYLCVSNNGQVKCSGFILGPYNGTTADAITPFTSTPVVLVNHEVQMISAGAFHLCYLDNGDVFCWGDNSQGQLGDGTFVIRETPVKVLSLNQKIIKIGTGYSHTCAVTDAGGVKCWGFGYNGRLGPGLAPANYNLPIDVQGLESGVTDIFVGSHQTCAVQDSQLKCWGNDIFVSTAAPTATPVLVATPVQPVGLNYSASMKVVMISSRMLILDNGVLKRWGRVGTAVVHGEIVPGFESQVTDLFVNENANTFCARKAGQVFCTAPETTVIAGAISYLPSTGIIYVTPANKCFFETDGTLKCQGNDSGQLGLGNPASATASAINRSTPVATGF